VDFMSVQPAESRHIRVSLPRTIKAVRAALPEDQRAQFTAELEDAAGAGGIAVVFNAWWSRALVLSTPAAVTALDAVRSPHWRGIPAAELFGNRWPAS
jgi:hypothetical protein